MFDSQPPALRGVVEEIEARMNDVGLPGGCHELGVAIHTHWPLLRSALSQPQPGAAGYERRTTDAEREGNTLCPREYTESLRLDIMKDLADCEIALAAATARIAEVERELQAAHGECAVAYEVIDSLPDDVIARVPEAKLLAAVRSMEAREKQDMAETTLQRRVADLEREHDAMWEALDRIVAMSNEERPKLECDNPMHSEPYNERGDEWRCERCGCDWYDSALGMKSVPPASVLSAIAYRALLSPRVPAEDADGMGGAGEAQ